MNWISHPDTAGDVLLLKEKNFRILYGFQDDLLLVGPFFEPYECTPKNWILA